MVLVCRSAQNVYLTQGTHLKSCVITNYGVPGLLGGLQQTDALMKCLVTEPRVPVTSCTRQFTLNPANPYFSPEHLPNLSAQFTIYASARLRNASSERRERCEYATATAGFDGNLAPVVV